MRSAALRIASADVIPQSTPQDRALIASEEGRVTFVYDDAISPPKKYIKGTRVKGNLTAGIGHLLSRGNSIFPEANAWIGKTIPASVIDHWLDVDLDEAEKAVHDLVKVPLNDNQRGTLFSFAFNVGVGGFAKSTLLKKLNAANYNAVPTELQKWTKTRINGVMVTSAGLVRRRSVEAAYWLGGKKMAITPANDNKPAGTEIGELGPKKWTPTEMVGAGSTVASVAVAGFSVTEPVLVYTFAGILVVALLVIGAIVVKRQFFPT
jgi:lysozyme